MKATPSASVAWGRLAPDVYQCLALVGLTLAVFLPCVGFEFVNWDDPWYVLHNSLITNWGPANLWDIATKPAVRNYAPVTMLGYLLQHSAWGFWPGGYHLTNVLLHAMNAVLVYALLKQLLQSRFIAFATAALFAVHPVQIETVAWVSSFKGILSATFILASLICWLRPQPDAGEPTLSPGGKPEAWGLLFHLLGLLTKALGITVPAIVFCYDVLIGKKRPADAMARQLLPCVLCVLVLLATMSAQTSVLGGVRGHLEWSKARIAAIDAVILWKYVALLVWPHDLSVLYDPPTSGISGTISLAAAGWLAVFGAAFAARRRFPMLLIGLVGFLALLFPVLNFFPITTLMNDRYLYLPSIPIFALIAAALDWAAAFGRSWLAGRQPAYVLSRALAWSAYAVLLLGYVTATHERLPVWRNDRALWEDAMRKSPGLTVVRIQWATALHNAQSNSRALAVLERALTDTNPDAADRRHIQSTITDWRRNAQPAL